MFKELTVEVYCSRVLW